jgi:hypoxanthine phosphoribosyltransferase
MLSPLKLSKYIDEKKISERVLEMAKDISKLAAKEPLVCVCVLKGSFVFYSDLIRAVQADVICDFLGVSSYNGTMNSSGEVKMTLDLTTSIEGKNVLIIEDIVDTGLTIEFLKRTLSLRKPKSLKTAALLLKPDSLKVETKVDYVGFKIQNDFVVGYGLDYQGYYRNLPYIAQVSNMN